MYDLLTGEKRHIQYSPTVGRRIIKAVVLYESVHGNVLILCEDNQNIIILDLYDLVMIKD